MRIEELREEHVRDAVRILILSFERELNGIFGDLELARELLFEYFSSEHDGCFVALDNRVVGFASVVMRKTALGKFLRKRLGFVRGTRASLLIGYLCPKPKGFATVNFIAVSPLRRGKGVGSKLMERLVSHAASEGAEALKCCVAVDNDAGIALLTKFGFEIEKMIDNRFAEKHFGRRQWYVMRRCLF